MPEKVFQNSFPWPIHKNSPWHHRLRANPQEYLDHIDPGATVMFVKHLNTFSGVEIYATGGRNHLVRPREYVAWMRKRRDCNYLMVGVV